MSLRTIDTLGQTLVRLRLLSADTLQECREALPASEQTTDGLLKYFEQNHTLTSYQIGQIQQGEFDSLVLGDFKLMYRNASGSFARVFRACSVTSGQMVGLKLLRQRWVADPEMVAQFHREAELCKRLRHKNIVPIYEIGQQGRSHFFTMEFVEGGNLRDFINIRKKLTAAEATRYVLDISEGLEYALEQGMTHRDMKMTNVLMSIRGVAKLVDFGLAGDDGFSGKGSGDGVARALEYATLERGSGAPENDPRSDLFFLGAIYYELLTGEPPYPRTADRAERKRLGRYQNIRPIRQIEPNLHRPVEKVVERLLEINPHVRYQSATDLNEELRGLLKYLGESTDLSTPSRATPAPANRESSTKPTVLCVESRLEKQDLLRKYITKHGYRALVVGDLDRALNRLNQMQKPDCAIFMAPSFGPEVLEAFTQSSNLPLVTLMVLSRKQAEWKSEVQTSHTARILVQPVKLRDVSDELTEGLKRLNASGNKQNIPS